MTRITPPTRKSINAASTCFVISLVLLIFTAVAGISGINKWLALVFGVVSYFSMMLSYLILNHAVTHVGY